MPGSFFARQNQVACLSPSLLGGRRVYFMPHAPQKTTPVKQYAGASSACRRRYSACVRAQVSRSMMASWQS